MLRMKMFEEWPYTHYWDKLSGICYREEDDGYVFISPELPKDHVQYKNSIVRRYWEDTDVGQFNSGANAYRYEFFWKGDNYKVVTHANYGDKIVRLKKEGTAEHSYPPGNWINTKDDEVMTLIKSEKKYIRAGLFYKIIKGKLHARFPENFSHKFMHVRELPDTKEQSLVNLRATVRFKNVNVEKFLKKVRKYSTLTWGKSSEADGGIYVDLNCVIFASWKKQLESIQNNISNVSNDFLAEHCNFGQSIQPYYKPY